MIDATFRRQLKRVRLQAQIAYLTSSDAPTVDGLEGPRAELASIEAELAMSAGAPEQPDAQLATALRLAPDELAFVWALVARAADPRLLGFLQVLCGTDVRRGLSVAHYAMIAGLDDDRSQTLAEILAPAHPLRRYEFLIGPDDTNLDVCTPLTIAPRVLAFLKGDDLPEELIAAAGGKVHAPHDARLDDEQKASLARIGQAFSSLDPVAVVVEGPTGVGRRTAIALAAKQTKRPVIALDLSRVSRSPIALEHALTALLRECLLTDAIPVLAEVDELAGGEAEGARLHVVARVLETAPGPIALTSRIAGFDIGIKSRRVLRIAWPVPETSARKQLWLRALGDDAAGVERGLDDIALRYRMGAGTIAAGAAAARTLKEARGHAATLDLHDLQMGIRNNIAERMGELATRIEVKQTWSDLVLPPETYEDVKGLVARIRHAHKVYEQWGFKQKMARGIGVAALFSGPPGTGKTMVAGLLARELDLELYQVDLSKVVSKWVGETEKQLARIFEAADAGHALLLFDEADSLFAKRTEVKSAVDRYANLEVNYLLQRIETFGGVTILTTNLDTSIDPALRRRLASHIVFHGPELAESQKLWERMLASDAPVARPLQLEKLAKTFPAMVGANIRNAVLAAAFMAAAENAPISMAHLERAARGEYRAMGRAL
ncbi:MAG: ATP-binding protein [Kofleriaceae bacterium]|nr:ATP-binding protein [Kofleriaceae bacterium]